LNIREFLGKLELRCEVQFDRYNDFTAFKESMEKMVNLEMFTDCCLKVSNIIWLKYCVCGIPKARG